MLLWFVRKSCRPTVSGAEAADVRTMGKDLMYIMPSLTKCVSGKTSKTKYKYQMYYACVCEENNQFAIIGFKKIKSIYEKHPHWAAYSNVKTSPYTDANGVTSSHSINVAELKMLLNTLSPCLQ